MREKKIKIRGKLFPQNLKVLRSLKEEDIKTDYEIREVFFLELEHSLWGFFPAMVKKDIILVLDQDYIKEVLKKLPKKEYKIGMTLFYIHKRVSVGYPADSYMGEDFSFPLKIFKKEDFKIFFQMKKNPFQWARGLIS